jgi:hypothetical protein
MANSTSSHHEFSLALGLAFAIFANAISFEWLSPPFAWLGQIYTFCFFSGIKLGLNILQDVHL